MKITCQWTDKMAFNAMADNHSVTMDAKSPIGSDTAPNPKQLLLMAICGCTGMDVVSLLRKHRQGLQMFSMSAEANLVKGHPAIFDEVKLVYHLAGEIETEKALEAVRLSQTLYCGVSAMVARACPIRYEVELNGQVIGEGEAHFSEPKI